MILLPAWRLTARRYRRKWRSAHDVNVQLRKELAELKKRERAFRDGFIEAERRLAEVAAERDEALGKIRRRQQLADYPN